MIFSDIDPAAVRAALAENGIVDGHVVDPEKLAANPFIQQVMADVEQIAADTPQAEERFSVIETENGYAVWDDAHNEVYTDSEGVQEEFTSEWQAEDYLKQVKKDVADKEAAEWLKVERAKVPHFTVELTSDAFDDPYIIRDNHFPDADPDRYYSLDGVYQTFETEEEAQQYADKLNEQEKPLKENPPQEPAEKTADTEPPLAPPRPGAGPVRLPSSTRRSAADRHEYQITDDAIGVGTPGERFNNNVRAIRLLKKLEAGDRLATPEEQDILSRYVGWGGLADCFDERHSKYAELKALLTEDEYAAARESTLTAFYTPPWSSAPSIRRWRTWASRPATFWSRPAALGISLVCARRRHGGLKIYGIELDSISGRIAQQLYQNHPSLSRGLRKQTSRTAF